MRLNFSTAIMLALISSLIHGCERTATDREEAASKGATSGQTPYGGASGSAGEGSTSDRSAPTRPSGK